MGIMLIISIALVLLAILWGPSLYVYKNKLQKHTPKTLIKKALGIELLATILLVAIADFIGLLNPAGYIILTTLFVSLSGFIYSQSGTDHGLSKLAPKTVVCP